MGNGGSSNIGGVDYKYKTASRIKQKNGKHPSSGRYYSADGKSLTVKQARKARADAKKSDSGKSSSKKSSTKKQGKGNTKSASTKNNAGTKKSSGSKKK